MEWQFGRFFFGNSYCLSKVCSIFLNAGFSTSFNGCISLAIWRVMQSVSVRHLRASRLYLHCREKAFVTCNCVEDPSPPPAAVVVPRLKTGWDGYVLGEILG